MLPCPLPPASFLSWVYLPPNQNNGSCLSGTDCCADIICYGLEYTPGVTGDVTSYTTGFFTECLTGMTPVISNASCQMTDHSFTINECLTVDSILFNSSGNEGILPVSSGVPVILHQVCFSLSPGESITIVEDPITDLSLSIDLAGGGFADEYPTYTPTTISRPLQVWPADVVATVACVAAATLPTPPVVMDLCGNTVPWVLTSTVNTPEPITCEGTRVYSFTYTDCSMDTHVWTYTYQIEYEPFLVPADGGETISCVDNIDVNTIMPPVVNDQCGFPITPAGPSMPVYDPPAFTCDGTVTYTWTYTDCEGTSIGWDYVFTVDCTPLTLRVLLEGPYDATGDTMLPDLNVNHVLPGQDKLLSPSPSVQLSAAFTPFGQPYNAPPWNYNGNTGMNYGDPSAPGAPMGVIPYPADVVDWILVTVRENGILPADNIWTCAGWVHTDGEVTFPESCGALSLDIMDDYYILVQHRNHLGILSPGPADMLCGSATIQWDFTTGDSYAPIFRVGEKLLEPGIWAMHAANGEQVTAIAAIESNDRTKWRLLQNVLGYSLGDHTMDVSTNSTDETIWKNNQNSSSGIIFY